MINFKNYEGMNEAGQQVKLTIASGPVIIEDNKVLLDKHGDDNFWKFPGGRLLDNLSVHQNAVSRAKEELGINIELIGEPFILVIERTVSDVKEYIILIHYLANKISREIKPGSEVKEWGWHDVKNLPADCAQNIKPVVKYFSPKMSYSFD